MNSSFPSSPRFERLQNIGLWLLAAFHVAMLASLLLVLGMLSTADAAEEVACRGTNILNEMKAENPAGYEKIVADGDKVLNGKGIFWKIEKPGLAPSWLMGTMHVTDPRMLKMPKGASEALAAARTVVIESDEVLDDKKATAGILARPELTMFTDGNSIESLLNKDDLSLLEAALKKRGIPLSAVSRMKPWMLMSFVSLPACETARKGQTAFLDKQIALDAAAEGKAVKGLETFAEQLSAMASIPTDMHMKSLIETIKLGPKMDDIFETMTEIYLSGNIGLTVPFLKQVSPEGESDDAGYAEFEELIVTKRNHHMAERAAPILAEGNAFVAVGALHLPGDEGLVELLRKQGFNVTSID